VNNSFTIAEQFNRKSGMIQAII